MQPNELSGSTLAYIGDAVWSLLVREYLVELGYGRAKDLQRLSVNFVSAKAQARFYEQVLALWQIPQEKCSPKELGNLILSVVLIYNSAARSLPFFFTEELERTAQAQATALSRYLASLADTDA